jgi:hypothetical protein
MNLKKAAREVAKAGRFLDDTLVHMNRQEVAGLAALAPNGKLPINPKTGLPEAFFFLPFLAAAAPAAAAGTAAAAAAPILAATTAAGAGTAAALGAGAAGAGAAGLGALGAAALPTATEIAATAAPAAATGLAAGAPAALAAAPEVAGGAGIGALTNAAIDPTITGSIAGGAGASGTGLVGGSISSAPSTIAGSAASGFPALPATAPIPTASPGAAAAAGPVAGPLTPSGGALSSPAAAVTSPMGAGASTPLTSGTTMASAAPNQGGLGGLLGKMGNIDLMKLAPLAMLMPRGGGSGEKKEKDAKVPNGYHGPSPVFPGPDYRGGIDPEFNYFPRFNMGGMVPRYAQGGIVNLPGAPAVMNQSPAMMQPQANMLSTGPTAPMPFGGAGIAQLMQPPPMAPPAQLDSPYAAPSGQPKSSGKADPKSDQELIAATVAALKGQAPNPDAIIAAFVQTFGQAALQDLITRMQTSGIAGGDGMSDSVPATINGSQPAALSQGEYVVPADVVSGLGNGSTDAGAKHLDAMVGRTRMARGGMVHQPPAINARSVMPV